MGWGGFGRGSVVGRNHLTVCKAGARLVPMSIESLSKFDPTYVALVVMIQGLVFTSSTEALAAPVSANWVYKISIAKGAPTPDLATKAVVAAGTLLGAVTVADVSDFGTIDGRGYSLRSHIKVANLLSMLDSNLNVVRDSNGIFANGIAFTQRYSDKRGSRPELLMVSNLKQMEFSFSNGRGHIRTEPIKFATVDIAMLPYAFIGQPAPKGMAFIAFTDGKSIYSTGLSVSPEKLDVAGKLIQAVRLSGQASGGALELWIREADGYPLHVRVGFPKYGAVLDGRILTVPSTLFVR